MANDGQIVFEVTADGKHAIADIKDITRAIQQETSKWDAATDASADHMESKFSGVLKKLVAGFSAVKIGKALLDFGKDALEAASDLQEVQNVVDQTFGESAVVIDSWAKNAASQFGLTETQAKRFSSTMGAMLKSSGLAGDKIVDVSTDLAGLAADMASFYNLDFDEAFAKIRSGISGQTMPLKELGIDMSVATLNAFALQKGLTKTFSEMSQGEQVMLRYQYLMTATADAQGDFANTLDGFANSKRLFESNLESIKTKLGELIIPAAQGAVAQLNDFLTTLTGTKTDKTVLDDFADIDSRLQAKLTKIQNIKNEATELSNVLDEIFGTRNEETGEIEGGKETTETLAKLGVKSDEAVQYLTDLGFSTDEIDEKQSAWLETCKRLVKTIPGLNSIINTETGEVKGGTQAVRDYIEAWEQGQTKLAMLGALEEKESAIAARFSDLPGLQLDMAVAKKRAREARDKLAKLYGTVFDEEGKIIDRFNSENKYRYEAGELNYKEVEDAFDSYKDLLDAEQKATDGYEKQRDALQEAKEAIVEMRETVNEMPGEIDEATNAQKKWLDTVGKTTDEIQELANKAQEAITALGDYAQGVHDAVEKSVDGIVNGFGKIETPMMKSRQKVKDLTKEIDGLDTKSKDYEKDLKKINDEIAKQRGEQISAQSMRKNLQQQAQYMEDYLKNLRKARELGVSDEVLAALSDGSAESYDYLEALAKATPKEAERINKEYQKVIDKKKELTDELTSQQLTADKTYQALAEKAKEAVAELDLEEEASKNAGATVKGVATGIKSHVGEVAEAVDAIIAEVNRLAGLGVDVTVSGLGGLSLSTQNQPETRERNGVVEATFASGTDFVPHDMTARIHEGETILKAQEAAVYRALKFGSIHGVDMDVLGGVMRDNVKAGGNVYLDGKIVGGVISDRQGRSYKSLQRSGWQS